MTSRSSIEIFYEVTGRGDPLVLVHGSWGDHSEWQGIIPSLAESFRVVAYDRRGHSRSERPPSQGPRREDEDDLVALLEALDCAPAHLIGNSFGASIALGLMARRTDVVRTVIAHEPPLLAVAADDPEVRPLMQEVEVKVQVVLGQLERGDTEGEARRFMEEVALGPGAWQQLSEEERRLVINNAPTFLDEQRDLQWANLDLTRLAAVPTRVLLTQGDQSPRFFQHIIAKLKQAMKRAEVRTIPGVGHIPHQTHPAEYAATILGFI